VSAHLDPAAFGEARGAARREMVDHLRGCAACRDLIAAHDPSLLFALLADTPIPTSLLDALSVEVARRAGDDRVSVGAAALGLSWPRRLAATAALVLMIVSGYATVGVRRSRVAPETPEVTAARRADVEVRSGDGVSQVIDLTVGETQIVMVYNGDLKL
jgi:hypothetical protein